MLCYHVVNGLCNRLLVFFPFHVIVILHFRVSFHLCNFCISPLVPSDLCCVAYVIYDNHFAAMQCLYFSVCAMSSMF
jgi:hypothetical protein